MEKGDQRVVGGNGRRVQVRAIRVDGWTAARRAGFLDHLAATCNVTLSARAVGMSDASAHTVRRRDPAFAEQWTAALEAGYQHLEAKLLAYALGYGDAARTEDAADAAGNPAAADVPFDPAAAMAMLARFRAAGSDPAQRHYTRHKVKHVTIEQVRDSLEKKLAAFAKRRAAADARK